MLRSAIGWNALSRSAKLATAKGFIAIRVSRPAKMDFISHLFLGLLVGFFASPDHLLSLVLWGALAGGFPDLDLFLFPLYRRLPSLAHRGLTHSVLFAVGVSTIGGAVVTLLTGLPLFLTLSVGLVAYLSHLAVDLLNIWSVPLLWPGKREVGHSVDGGVVFFGGTLLIGAIGLVAFSLEQYALVDTLLLFAAVTYPAYLLLKLVCHVLIVRRLGLGREDGRLYPTLSPFHWIAMEHEARPNGHSAPTRRMTLTAHSLFSRKPRALGTCEYGPALTETPIGSAEEAIAYSLSLERVQRLLEWFGPTYAHVEEQAGGWTVHWLVLEWVMFRRAPSTRVSISADGEVEVKRGFLPLRRISEESTPLFEELPALASPDSPS